MTIQGGSEPPMAIVVLEREHELGLRHPGRLRNGKEWLGKGETQA